MRIGKYMKLNEFGFMSSTAYKKLKSLGSKEEEGELL